MDQISPAAGLDLEEFRQARGLSYDELGALIGSSAKSTTRTWAIGMVWPDAERVENIITKTDGAVTLEAMHRRRLQWLRDNGKVSVPLNCGGDAEACGEGGSEEE